MVPEMRLITSEEWCRRAPFRFRNMFFHPASKVWDKTDRWDSEIVYNRMINTYGLNREKIEQILETNRWTILECGVCCQDVSAVVEFPLNDDRGNICLECVGRIYDMLLDEEMKDIEDIPLQPHDWPKIFIDWDGESE